MASTATAPKTSSNEVLNDAVRANVAAARKATVQVEQKANVSVTNNTFAKIVFDEKLTLDEKAAAVRKALAFTGSKEETKQAARELEEFKEYLQQRRSAMAEEIIKLTDTEAFADLKRIYDEINTALVDFDTKMAPLTDILDAIFKLRTDGKTLNAFKDIQEDRRREKEFQDKRSGFETSVNTLTGDIASMEHQITAESQKKSFFGMGKIKADAQATIDRLRRDIADRTTQLNAVKDDIIKLNTENEAVTGRVSEYDEQKKKLRELLDITTEGHRQRQEDLVKAALNFVETTKDRVGAVRQHLDQMNNQVGNLGEANNTMGRAFAIINDGTKGAMVDSQALRAQFQPPAGGEESAIAKMDREEKLQGLDGHIKMLDNSSADTAIAAADLTTQAIRIKEMQDSNEDQINQARQIHTQGVAGVADRLSVVLNAVSSAATAESASLARDTLAIMNDRTDTIAQKEVIKQASGLGERKKDIEKAIDSLTAYGEVRQAATDLTREGLKEMREALGRMENVGKGVHEAIRESMSIHADADATQATASRPNAPATDAFGLGKV